MKYLRITPKLSEIIIRKRNLGQSFQSISDELNISKSTVAWHIKMHREHRVVHQGSTGRPPLTSSSTDREIVLCAKRNRFASATALGNQFKVSRQTIIRRCSRKGLRRRISHEDDLSNPQKRRRVAWCRQHLATNFIGWMFSDESTFELGNLSIPRRQYVTRMIKEKYAGCCIQSGVYLRQKLMVWGAISSSGPACFVILRQNVTARAYIQTLSDNLLPYLDHLSLNHLRNTVFQQDNAPPQRAVITRTFFQENGINVPQWPALSPDLNPIEEVWAIMKSRVRRNRPKSLAALRLSIRTAWNSVVTRELCTNLFNSIPNRLKNVISRKGLR